MKVVTIGRSEQNDIVINDYKASRHHLQIVQQDNGQYSLVDFGSTNGTFVNGQRVFGQISLNPTDIVRIGSTTLPWRNYFNDSHVSNISKPQSAPNWNPTPSINIPSDININQNIKSEHADVRKRGDDFSVGFFRNLGDQMGSGIGKTLGCIISIIIVVAILAIIGVTCAH